MPVRPLTLPAFADGMRNAVNGTYGPRNAYATRGAKLHAIAAIDMMTATERVEPLERNAIRRAIAPRVVKTGHSSVPPTVRMKSGRIGPGITIHKARKTTSSENARGTMRDKLSFPVLERTFTDSHKSREHRC